MSQIVRLSGSYNGFAKLCGLVGSTSSHSSAARFCFLRKAALCRRRRRPFASLPVNSWGERREGSDDRTPGRDPHRPLTPPLIHSEAILS
jgi:hypothetical protein